MAVGRTCTITMTVVNSDQTIVPQNTNVTAQLMSTLAGSPLFEYFVVADPANGEVINTLPVVVQTNASGLATFTLTAPQDIVAADYLGNHASGTYYQFSLPSGIIVSSTNFAYSASPRDIAAVNSATVAPSYPTAAVTFQVVTPAQTGTSLVVTAYLNTDVVIAGQLVRAAQTFQTVLNGAGTGTLALPPNDQMTPTGTFWYVVLGTGGTAYPISVPTAGGAFTALFTNPLASGTLVSQGALPAGALPYYTTAWGRQTLGKFLYFP